MSAASQYQPKANPQKFALWIAIGTMVMAFASLTSAYVVRRAAGNWLEFPLPNIFFASAAVLMASSVTLHFSLQSFKRKQEKLYKTLLLSTFALAIVFVLLQYQGWVAMDAMGVTFTVNPSSSFIYVISGLHVAHVLGGVVALTTALVHAFYLPFKPTLRRRQRFELVAQYWHFVDLLWLYLLVFFASQS